MATNTYVALQTQTLTSAASTVTFNSIPQTYTDLRFVCSFNSSSYAVGGLQFNGVASGYSTTYMYSGVTSQRLTGQSKIPFQQGTGPITQSNTFQLVITDIMNYSNTNTYKTVLWKTGNPTTTDYPGYEWGVGLSPSTSAITSITFDSGGTNIFQTGSTFSLYGIAAGAAVANTAKATGGTITYGVDGYTYHTFNSSGTFTPSQALTADILVVAGGGSGQGAYYAGAGGAGGFLGFAGQSLTSGTGYTCTVGAGGAAVGTYAQASGGNNGSNSTFTGLTAAVGGGGAGGTYASGHLYGYNGGSGGGASGSADGTGSSFNANGGSGTSGQGYAGGATTGQNGGHVAGGGGGGAGGVGSAGINGPVSGGYGIGGDGGPGAQWLNGNYYAGGGGGGSIDTRPGYGGIGGGGAGSNAATATSGSANTGGGGGGLGNGGSSYYSGAGGSGVIIVRYVS